MRRVSVTGTSGSGKSTVGRALAGRLGVPYVELDALHHGPGWREASAGELRELVEAAIAAAPNGWVIDGNYQRKLGDLVLRESDTLVWLDLPLPVTLRRLWRRTWRRILRRELLWNGNRESLRTAFWGRESLFAWAIRSHRRRPAEIEEIAGRLPHLRIVRLRTSREVERFLACAHSSPSSSSPSQYPTSGKRGRS